MDFSGCRFIYAGTASEQYGLRFVNCETSVYKRIAGQTRTVSVFNRRNRKNLFIEDDYTGSPISIDVEIARDDINTAFDEATRRAVENWLFNRKSYYKLYVELEDDCTGESYEVIDGQTLRFYFNCRFINPQKILGGDGVVGFRATMECDSGMLWQDEIRKEYTLGHTGQAQSSIITVRVGSDGEEYIYPSVIMEMGSGGGDLRIVNNSDSTTRLTSFKGLGESAVVTMHSETNRISGEYYSKFYDRNFIRLLPGENAISVTGQVGKITFLWKNRKYL